MGKGDPGRVRGGTAHLSSLTTHEPYRRRGYAEATVAMFLGTVRERGCRTVTLYAGEAAGGPYGKPGFGQLTNAMMLVPD
ncbi:GNAT family N-acetyltransferase [Streptomyces sp. URMC 129]|uniref:GNAT family N-acetyltransferase n=1 Tax=Streptomyces sp. URMC 129 TaxID=3423407 RepID=UPI003F1DDC0B